MYVKFYDIIPTLSCLLGLLKVPWIRLAASKTPHLYIAFDMFSNFQTKFIWDVKSMCIVAMHKPKTTVKYWDMLLSLSGPLGLQLAADINIMVGGEGGFLQIGGTNNNLGRNSVQVTEAEEFKRGGSNSQVNSTQHWWQLPHCSL